MLGILGISKKEPFHHETPLSQYERAPSEGPDWKRFIDE